MREIRKVSCAVVGGAGFLGSHLTRTLIEDRECYVVVIDNLCAGRREFVHPKAKFIHADITDSEDYLKRMFRHWEVKYVFNCAAYPYVPDSYSRPSHVCNVNFHGAMNVINAAEEAGVTGILQVSSAEVYGGDSPFVKPVPGMKINENCAVVPHSTYGASKAAIDFYVQCRWREAGTPCLTVRQFNALGENDVLHPYVVPEIIGQLHRSGEVIDRFNASQPPFSPDVPTVTAGRPVVLLGNNSSRDFIYAGDAVRVWVELLEKGQFGEVYNLGSESSIKIYDLAKLIGKLMGFQDVRIEQDSSKVRAWEIWSLQSDNTKLNGVVPVRFLTSLEDALRRMIEDYRKHGKYSWEK